MNACIPVENFRKTCGKPGIDCGKPVESLGKIKAKDKKCKDLKHMYLFMRESR